MKTAETSVVIRAFNEQKHLADLLEGLNMQSYSDFEVIVVDSGSYDRTPQIAVQYGARLVRIESRDFTFGYSLNVGIQNSAGSYVVIVSAHTKPLDRSWLAALLQPLRDEQVAMVYGRQVGTSDSNYSEFLDFLRIFRSEPALVGPPDFFANNANAAIKKELWRQHPYDEALPGLEDVEWAKYWIEKNYRVLYEPKAVICHIHEETARQIRRRFYREAVAAHRLGTKRVHDIPSELWREGKHLIQDVLAEPQSSSFAAKVTQVATYRLNKVIGTIQGLRDGLHFEDPTYREEFFFDKYCKAVVIEGPGHASLKEVAVPELKPADVLIKVAYQGVCATDVEIFEGTLGYYKAGVAKYPIVPGHEFSGRVVKVGPNVTDLRVGDLVVVECIQSCRSCEECRDNNWIACQRRKEVGVMGIDGGYAEYFFSPAHFVHRLPQGTDLRKAALCEPIAVILKGMKRLDRVSVRKDNRRCAVIGAGPIGHLCARILVLRGHRVRVYDRDAMRLALFKESEIETSTELSELSNFDSIVEATGALEPLEKALRESRSGATLLLLGFPYGRREFSFEDVVAYDRTIVGSVGSGPEEFEEAIRLLAQLDLSPFSQTVLPLSEYQHAWEISKARRSLKVLLAVDPSLEVSSGRTASGSAQETG